MTRLLIIWNHIFRSTTLYFIYDCKHTPRYLLPRSRACFVCVYKVEILISGAQTLHPLLYYQHVLLLPVITQASSSNLSYFVFADMLPCHIRDYHAIKRLSCVQSTLANRYMTLSYTPKCQYIGLMEYLRLTWPFDS